jgi:alpha-tubulin suppressor-like RCC1 family protein
VIVDLTGGDADGNRLKPTTVPDLSAVQVNVGYQHTCAVLSTGSVKCWGNNADGQLSVASEAEQKLDHYGSLWTDQRSS